MKLSTNIRRVGRMLGIGNLRAWYKARRLRALQDKKTDVYIVSAPKAGRTWLSVLLVKLLSDRFKLENNFSLLDVAFEHPFPGITCTHDLLEPTGRFSFVFDDARYKDKKVVFLARDPRDVVVSLYHQLTKRQHIFSGDISVFLRDERYGIRHIVDFMNLWIAHQQDNAEFLLIRYEDLKANPRETLASLLSFIGIDGCEPYLDGAITFASFDSMRELEKKDFFKDNRLRAKDANDPNTFKVRKGTVGGFREELSDSDLQYVNQECTRLSQAFNYSV